MIIHRFKKRHKFNAKKTQVDGITFDSQLEANCYRQLKKLQEKGSLLFFIRQPKFDLPGPTTYTADFLIFWEDGTVEIYDCKGVETKEFIRAKKQVEDIYPVDIKVIKKDDLHS